METKKADELIKMFEEPHDQIINNLETFKTRNYYPRPTFPDMQFEERNQYTQASYTSGTIYEWNIDGMTEYNILTKLQEMTMVSTAYKLNNRLLLLQSGPRLLSSLPLRSLPLGLLLALHPVLHALLKKCLCSGVSTSWGLCSGILAFFSL